MDIHEIVRISAMHKTENSYRIQISIDSRVIPCYSVTAAVFTKRPILSGEKSVAKCFRWSLRCRSVPALFVESEELVRTVDIEQRQSIEEALTS